MKDILTFFICLRAGILISILGFIVYLVGFGIFQMLVFEDVLIEETAEIKAGVDMKNARWTGEN